MSKSNRRKGKGVSGRGERGRIDCANINVEEQKKQ